VVISDAPWRVIIVGNIARVGRCEYRGARFLGRGHGPQIVAFATPLDQGSPRNIGVSTEQIL